MPPKVTALQHDDDTNKRLFIGDLLEFERVFPSEYNES